MSKCTSSRKKLRKEVTLTQLQNIDQKMQKGAFVTVADNHFFTDLVNSAYASVPTAQVFLDLNGTGMVFQTPPLRIHLHVQVFRDPQKQSPFWAVLPSKLNKIPTEENSRKLLGHMLTPYALLPKNLTAFQERQLIILEFCLKYTACYIIQNRYRRDFCSLPQVDNKMRAFYTAWADPWYRLLNLCSLCMDFLDDNQKQKYSKSWNWLDAIVKEYRQTQFLELLTQDTPLVPKSQQAEYWYTYAGYLKKRKVPPSINPSGGLFLLLDIATRLAGDALTEYISSIERYAQKIKKHSPFVTAVGFDSIKSLVLQEERGKRKLKENVQRG